MTRARKVVTVLFSDLTGYTALGDELDPESLGRLMGRYFEEMKIVLDRHGGTVEKFIGDAVMAVFGVPRAHEDDAHRALRAAVEMRDALNKLNEEIEGAWGVRVLSRTGVNTGEVLAEDPSSGHSFIAGDAVNLASRLETAADPGEILIGEATYRLVRDVIEAEPTPPLVVKGKRDPVAAWRVLAVSSSDARWARRLDSPLVGRDAELHQLEEIYARAAAERSAQLVTIVGPAGVGKSRLASEFLAGIDADARAFAGRCLPYGEGITFWPIVEILRDAAGLSELRSAEDAMPKVLKLLPEGADSELIAERLTALIGLGDLTAGVHETFWAVRKLLEGLAAQQPLVVTIDDIHWAEPTLLDLLEYLVDWIRDLPVVLMCLTRPELVEVRGTWVAPRRNASVVTLPPLSGVAIEGLIANLLKGGTLVDDARERIADAAEGNPLFVEETLGMLVDDGLLARRDGSWEVAGDVSALSIPPTIHALLSARLDRLDDEERAVIERAAVVGRVFWWGAVSDLCPEETRSRVGGHLQALARKDLIQPDRSDVPNEDAFRFAHILMVDAAYSRIPKALRADLHEQFADWIERKTGDRVGEYEEIIGYHLEQAHHSLAQLGQADARVHSLGASAGRTLTSAGRRAFARGDMPAAVNLLSRAASLVPPDDPARLELLPALAFALLETGDFERLQQVCSETSNAAEASGDGAAKAYALVLSLWVRLFSDPEGWAEVAEREAMRAIAVFEEEQDERGLGKAWSLLGLYHLLKTEFGAAEEAWDKAALHAGAAGDERERLESLSWVPLCVWGGATPVEAGIQRCEDVLRQAGGDRKAMSTALFTRGMFEAMRGCFDEARVLMADAKAMLEEVSLPVWTAGPLAQMTAWVELFAGDQMAAERELRRGVETLREIGELAWLSTVAGMLGEVLYVQGRYDEADEFARLADEAGGGDDAFSQGLSRSVRAKVLARQGDLESAEKLGRQAVAITEATDFLFLRAFALTSLGEALQLDGKRNEAEGILAAAVRTCEDKGFTAGADRIRAMLSAPTPDGA